MGRDAFHYVSFLGFFRYWKASPQSLLFSRLNNPNSLSLSSQEMLLAFFTLLIILLLFSIYYCFKATMSQ